MQGDAPAVGRQAAGNGQANATVGTGNQCGFLLLHAASPLLARLHEYNYFN
jgi:hypothetical protein